MSAFLKIWGGVECTVNRVYDSYHDQLMLSGHDVRKTDLAAFAALGIKTLRFPILWERLAPEANKNIDWSWADRQLNSVRELGISIIAGLVHHGSGPRYTELLDPDFPSKLADFALQVARRYPWIEAYTPINEPLTTARFSGLYGFWFPHHRSDASFARILKHECQGIAVSMQAIRSVNPDAILVQTEDLGKVFSTPHLKYQANFENARRWLTFDILLNQFNPQHHLWRYFANCGLSPSELRELEEIHCPPDILGVNHYVLSNRFLDERVERYPPRYHGGNGRTSYADIEAVRVGAENIIGPEELLEEIWNRYHLPLAVTEAHIACTHDEQLRWLHEMVSAATQLRASGVDVRAVTAWSLLGSFDWDSLVTRKCGNYEAGVFDLRALKPRPTALAQMIKALNFDGHFEHPVLDVAGWWHRPERLAYEAVPLTDTRIENSFKSSLRMKLNLPEIPRKILVFGGSGTLASAFRRICSARGLAVQVFKRQEADISNEAGVREVINAQKPWAIINAAGYCRVDLAEREEKVCFQDNVLGPAILAKVCSELNLPLMTFSSDLVFDGLQRNPYVEGSIVSPINVYGRSKAESETRVLNIFPHALVIRTSAFFGPWDKSNFLTNCLQQAAAGVDVLAATDVIISPTYVPHLVCSSLDLLIDGEKGLWHLANVGEVNWHEFATIVLKKLGLKTNKLVAVTAEEFGWLAPRPPFSVLGSEKGSSMPTLDAAICQYIQEYQGVRIR